MEFWRTLQTVFSVGTTAPMKCLVCKKDLLTRHRRKNKAEAAAANQELRPSEAPSDVQEKPSTVEEVTPKATPRVHSLRDSFQLLTQLVESSVSPPTQLELAQLSPGELWTLVGKWLECSSCAKKDDPPRSSIRSEWKALRRVAAATSTLAFVSQSLERIQLDGVLGGDRRRSRPASTTASRAGSDPEMDRGEYWPWDLAFCYDCGPR